MSTRHRLSILLVTALAGAPAFGAQDDPAQRQARIEAGLPPPAVLKGATPAYPSLAEEMKRLKVPGVSVAVIHDGKLAWAKGYGLTAAGGAPVTADTLFQAASISKPVTAVAALRLVERGVLDLDADANTYLKTWKLPASSDKTPVTLRQLLSHTAGIGVHGFPGYAAGLPLPSVVQVLDGEKPANTKAVRIDFAPGSKYQYSGGGYTVVQQMLTDASGKGFAELLADSVLGPAGMRGSAFTQPASAAQLARAAMPHKGDGSAHKGGPYSYPELAAAGLWTTPSDLARFAIALQEAVAGKPGALLSPAMAKTMLTPVKNGYGLGLDIETSGASLAFGHGGSNQGYQNSLYAYSTQGDGAVVMTNGDAGSTLARDLIRSIAAEYGWPGYRTEERSAIAVAPARAKALAGKYVVKGLGDFEISYAGGKLMFWLRPDKGEPLYAASPTVLFVLGQGLELRLAQPWAKDGGRIVSGSFDVHYTRLK